jgi:uncharacterized protein (DUF885 family)
MFKIGTLVKVAKRYVGVIVDTGVHHDGDWKYLILFSNNGEYGWWTDKHLEVLCK